MEDSVYYDLPLQNVVEHPVLVDPEPIRGLLIAPQPLDRAPAHALWLVPKVRLRGVENRHGVDPLMPPSGVHRARTGGVWPHWRARPRR